MHILIAVMAKAGTSSKTSSSGSLSSKKADTLSALNEPLFTIHNPFRYIFLWLEDIKNWIKKDSDGEIRIHIPFKWFVTALVMFLAGGAIPAYWQGKAVEYAGWISRPTPTPVIIVQPTLTPAPVLVTRLGVIKATYQVRNLLPTLTPAPVHASASATQDGAAPSAGSAAPLRYVLMTDTYKLIYLSVPESVSLQKFIGDKALITGYYTSSTNTLAVQNADDIEVVY